MFDEVLARFAAECPLTVMARMTLQRALDADWVNAVFEQHRQMQYTRELLFSTVVDLMALVALGLRPSLHAAAKRAHDLPVSLTALYDKVNHAEPAVLRALVRGGAERLAPVMRPLRTRRLPVLAGYRVRVADGNHLPASEKRLAPLRGFRGAALPGQSLVVFDPDLGLVVDVVPCEDAHASEQGLLAVAAAHAAEGDLWLADRNFSTRALLYLLAVRGAAFIIREHGAHPNPTAVGPRRRIGRTETGVVHAQRVTIPTEGGGTLALRRIEVELDTPTTDGETVVRVLTNLPVRVADARRVARLYLTRWTVEHLFQRLEAALHSEVRTLGQPRAALLAFTTAVLAYNVLAVLESAIEDAHALPPDPAVVSTWYVAEEVRAHYAGMMVALSAAEWVRFDALSPTQLAQRLRHYARQVDLRHVRKHPRKEKVPVPKGYVSRKVAERHVSTARVLRDGGVR